MPSPTRKLINILGLGIAAAALIPISIPDLPSRPDPAQDFEDALRQFEAVRREDERLGLIPECRTSLLHHSDRTAKALALLIGIGNCPLSFDALGNQFFEQGWNVYIPPLPLHGFGPQRYSRLRNLTAEDYAAFSDQVADFAAGLGNEVYVVGHSAGANAAAWIGQHRRVKRVVALSPVFPSRAQVALMNLGMRLPPISLPVPKSVSVSYGYRGGNTRAYAETLRFGQALLNAAGGSQPQAESLAVVTAADDQVSTVSGSDKLVERWRGHGVQVDFRVLPFEKDFGHDYITPELAGEKVQEAYPYIMEILEG